MARSAIFAQSLSGYIGRKGNHPLLWRLPGDLPRFKRLTHNAAIIMGRFTFESLPGMLPHRFHIVVSTHWPAVVDQEKGYAVVSSLPAAFHLATQLGYDEQFVIGGGDLINQALPYCHCVHRTLVYEMRDTGDEMSYVQLPGPQPFWGRFELMRREKYRIKYGYDYEVYRQLSPLDP